MDGAGRPVPARDAQQRRPQPDHTLGLATTATTGPTTRSEIAEGGPSRPPCRSGSPIAGRHPVAQSAPRHRPTALRKPLASRLAAPWIGSRAARPGRRSCPPSHRTAPRRPVDLWTRPYAALRDRPSPTGRVDGPWTAPEGQCQLETPSSAAHSPTTLSASRPQRPPAPPRDRDRRGRALPATVQIRIADRRASPGRAERAQAPADGIRKPLASRLAAPWIGSRAARPGRRSCPPSHRTAPRRPVDLWTRPYAALRDRPSPTGRVDGPWTAPEGQCQLETPSSAAHSPTTLSASRPQRPPAPPRDRRSQRAGPPGHRADPDRRSPGVTRSRRARPGTGRRHDDAARLPAPGPLEIGSAAASPCPRPIPVQIRIAGERWSLRSLLPAPSGAAPYT